MAKKTKTKKAKTEKAKAKTRKKRGAEKRSKKAITKKPAKKPAPNKVKDKPQKKTVWKISPEKHGHTDVWTFKKDGVTIEVSQTYRFTSIVVAQKPNLTKYDPNTGIKIDEFNYSYCELGDDSWGPDWTFPTNFPSEEQKRIKRLWDEEHHHGMMKEGWTCDDETYFYGPLSVEEVEAEYPHNPV